MVSEEEEDDWYFAVAIHLTTHVFILITRSIIQTF
jgi:hypothetical protein